MERNSSPNEWTVRPGTLEDLPFLREMLYLAASWNPDRQYRPFDEVLSNDTVRRYVDGWGRGGDHSVIAVDFRFVPLGAAWYRLFDQSDQGFGFINDAIPEISIGVLIGYRGRGIGRALLETLVTDARIVGFSSLSLSVEDGNPARKLYERIGFRQHSPQSAPSTLRLDLDK